MNQIDRTPIFILLGFVIGGQINDFILFNKLKTTIKAEIKKLQPIETNGKVYFITIPKDFKK